MMEFSWSFVGWVVVLLIQVIVHVKVVYLRKGRDDDDTQLIDAADHSSSSLEEPSSCTKTGEQEVPTKNLTRSYSDPALDEDDLFEFDEPPNLKLRLSQTGSEMMSSCKSLESYVESYVHEQILSQ